MDTTNLRTGDQVDVFVYFTKEQRKFERGSGYICRATVIWNGTTQILPYCRTRGGFTVRTTDLQWGARIREGVDRRERVVHYYRRGAK